MVVVSLPVLLGAAAAAIDLAVLTAEGQKVQNVIDSAALSGARCYTTPEAVDTVVKRVVAENNQATTWQVTASTICYEPGDTVPGYGTLSGDDHAVEVNGQAPFHFFFGRLIGLDSVTVYRRAVARVTVQTTDLDDTFIFGGATTADYDAVKIMGRQVRLIGDIHSNSNVVIGGLRTTINGDLSYAGVFKDVAPRSAINGTAYQTGTRPYPINYTFAQFDVGPWDQEVFGDYSVQGAVLIPSGRWRIHGNLTLSGNGLACSDALFVVDGSINANASNKLLNGVTFVAHGQINLGGAGSSYSPYQNNLLAFTDYGNPSVLNEQGVSINAAGCWISGICFAPNSNISVNGSSEYSYSVGIIGETVDLMGSDSVFSGPPRDPSQGDILSDVRLIV